MENHNQIRFTKGNGGLPKIQIHTEWSDAEIYLQGAHVTHFQRKGEVPLLFLSAKSRLEHGRAIRGGIPIIFPWFGSREGKPAHGFARTQRWELDEISSGSRGATLKLSLPESAESAEFPKFLAEYFVTVGEILSLELKITNRSSENFSFEDCLHTYFEIGDANQISIVGLKNTEFLDKVENFTRKTEMSDAIRISGETDRVYLNTKSTVEIHDSKLRRKIIVEKEGSLSTVVWNPWIEKSKAMSDFGDDEYLRMICVESGNVSENKLNLPPGKSASLKVHLRTRPE